MILMILDISNLIYRAFYSINPDNFKRSDGLSTNAVYGVATMIIKLVKSFKKDYPNITLVACLDSPTCSQNRKKQQNTYKNNRLSAPSQLKHQFIWIRDMLNAMDIHNVEYENYEADDLIASYTSKFSNTFDKIIIVSPDKDMYQLLDSNVSIYNPRKKMIESIDDFEYTFGFSSQNFVLYQALIGDKIDNVIGVKGIGHKHAVNIIKQTNGDLNLLFDEDFAYIKKNLIMHNKELIISNLSILTLCKNIHVKLPSSSFNFKQLKTQKFESFLDSMEIQAKHLRQYTTK